MRAPSSSIIFTDDGATTISGAATVTGGDLTINGVTMTVGSFNQTCATCETLLNGGVLDPPAIEIQGGIFSGRCRGRPGHPH
jgi:hypothetical protein